jgi:hypothetical protein
MKETIVGVVNFDIDQRRRLRSVVEVMGRAFRGWWRGTRSPNDLGPPVWWPNLFARMRAAIETGLESAPIGVVTAPGTKNPKYVPTEPRPLVSSQRDVEHA